MELNSYLKNYLFGGITGSTAAIFSHPFFRLKIAFQDEEIITKQNFKRSWLYKGCVRAMIGYGIEKMLVFGTYDSLTSRGFNPTLAGFLSGIAASFSITPFEQLMIDKGLNIKNFKLRHLYSGIFPTIIRESVGFAIHFTTYDYISNLINKEREFNRTIICGIIAVSAGWTIILPVDRLKTQIQTGKFNIKTYNIMKSYQGMSYALLRAIPFHVTCFVLMEFFRKGEFEKIKSILE